jgi:hypothetical protein
MGVQFPRHGSAVATRSRAKTYGSAVTESFTQVGVLMSRGTQVDVPRIIQPLKEI